MSTYAVVSSATNICDNVVVWNDTRNPWTPPADHYTVDIDGLSVGIGCYYDQQSKKWTAPPTVTASFNPTPVFVGQNTTLSWSTQNATSVTISDYPGQTFPVSGDQVMVFSSAGTKTVTVTATGLAGSMPAAVVIKVYAAGEILPQ